MNDYPNNNPNNNREPNNNGYTFPNNDLNNNYNVNDFNYQINNDPGNSYNNQNTGSNDPYSYQNNTPASQPVDTGFVLINETGSINNNAIQNTVPNPTPNPAPIIQELNKQENFKKTKAKSKDKFKRTVALACICSVLGGVSIGLGIPIAQELIVPQFSQKESKEQEQPSYFFAESNKDDITTETVSPTVSSPNIEYTNYADVIKKVEPSVVRITSVAASSDRFFGLPSERTGQGSGIIFHEDADKVYIATNFHVVTGAESIMVTITNKEPVPAKVVGSEAAADIAVIVVPKDELKKVGINQVVLATFGDSDGMQVGDVVLAIGNALGEGNTATNGIIGAKDKEINVEGRTLKVIQTNAAINPGNSGGPLVNMRGEVIGINTAKLLQYGYSGQSMVEGMGYSISSNIVKPIVEQLMKPRPFLGITGKNITQEMAEMFNLPQIGVMIEEVVPGGAAEAAGLRSTDIITVFDGKAIFNMEQLLEAIKECEIGKKVEIKVLRQGQMPLTVTAELKSSTESYQ